MSQELNRPTAVRYATTFEQRLFRTDCTVEVAVDVSTCEGAVTLEMKPFFGGRPAFRISLEELKQLSLCIKTIHQSVGLLDAPLETAGDHQLNVRRSQATLTVVRPKGKETRSVLSAGLARLARLAGIRPKGKEARFVLSIGLYHREGRLSELDAQEIDGVVAQLEEKKNVVLRKVAALGVSQPKA